MNEPGQAAFNVAFSTFLCFPNTTRVTSLTVWLLIIPTAKIAPRGNQEKQKLYDKLSDCKLSV